MPQVRHLRAPVTSCISGSKEQRPFESSYRNDATVWPLPPPSCTNSCTHSRTVQPAGVSVNSGNQSLKF